MTGFAFNVQADGLSKMQNRFRRWRGMAPIGAAEATHAVAVWTVQQVQQNASGRPGPNVETGEYRASIRIFEFSHTGSTSEAVVGTDAEQAARLELGFVGVDSLGRHYAQPPFPHWRPGMIQAAVLYRVRMRTFAQDLVQK